MDGGVPVSRCRPSAVWVLRKRVLNDIGNRLRTGSKILAQEIPKSRRSSLARSAARGGLQFNRANILIEEIGNVRRPC